MVSLNGEISADIAIVGGGIGGPALACALRHSGSEQALCLSDELECFQEKWPPVFRPETR